MRRETTPHTPLSPGTEGVTDGRERRWGHGSLPGEHVPCALGAGYQLPDTGRGGVSHFTE